MIHLLALDSDGSIVDLIEREWTNNLPMIVHTASNHYELVVKCQEQQYQAVFIDLDHPRSSRMEEIEQLKSIQSSLFCYFISSLPQWEQAVQAFKAGADDYLAKPTLSEKIPAILVGIQQRSAQLKLVPNPKLEFNKSKRIIGRSFAIKKVYDLIQRLARVETSVLIRGESGTGKELVAQALHYNSTRKQGPFVAVNCGAIPESLIESELFGYEKGTFTGADKKKLGKFQFASGGSIFLDEIGDVSPQMQVKLLRVLQEKIITPVGSNLEIPIDVRIISATNKPLEKMMQEGKFRSDLYYRLNVMPINLPRLLDRLEDIEDLASFMIEKFNRLHERSIQQLRPEALAALKTYDWPGNIRELENVIEHAFIIEGSDEIHLDSLPPHIQKETEAAEKNSSIPEKGEFSFQDEMQSMEQLIAEEANSLKFPELKEQFEKEFIKRALKAFNGRINQTAEQTQMTKVTLLRKLEKYNINPKEFQH